MSQKNSVSPIDWREETDTWISKNESKFESNQQEFLEMGLLNKTFRMSLQSKVFDYTDSSQEFCFHAQKHKTNGLESSVNLWIFQGVCVWGGVGLTGLKRDNMIYSWRKVDECQLQYPICMLSACSLWWATARICSLVIWDWKKQGTLLGSSHMWFMAKYSYFGESQLSVTVPG